MNTATYHVLDLDYTSSENDGIWRSGHGQEESERRSDCHREHEVKGVDIQATEVILYKEEMPTYRANSATTGMKMEAMTVLEQILVRTTVISRQMSIIT